MIELYSIDKKGKIRVFKVHQDGQNLIQSATGILGGSLTIKNTTISKGKQGRTIPEQVEFEMNALINTKIDEGYKSAKDLSSYGLELINKRKLEAKHHDLLLLCLTQNNVIPNIFEILNIKFNTNKYWLPLPMLAEKWKDHKKKASYPAILQPKLNGVRCIAIWDKEESKIKLLSRGGQVYQMPEIELALRDFLMTHPTVQLDGELYKHGMPLQDISGIVRLEDKEQFGRKHVLEYHIYDLAVEDVQQIARTGMMERYVEEIKHNSIVAVPSITINSEEEVKTYHDAFVATGYEGAMVRDQNGYYMFGFRDACLLKVKEFIDEEFEIIGCDVDSAKGIESFVFVLQNNINDISFKARPTGTIEDKEIWRQNIDKFIGKKATVRYQERTVNGLPHQGHVRADKTELLIEAIRDYD